MSREPTPTRPRTSQLRLIARLWPYVRGHRRLALAGTAALFAEIAVRLAEPWPLKVVIDHVLLDQPLAWSWLGRWAADRPMGLVALAAATVLVVAGLRAVFAYASSLSFAITGNRVLTEIRASLFGRLQHLSLAFHDRARGGDLLIRVIGDVGIMKDVAVTAFLPLAGRVLMLTGMFGVMFYLHWQLALLALAPLSLFLVALPRLSGKIRDASQVQRRRESAMASTAAESFTAIKTVQALSLESGFGQQFSAQNQKSLREGVKVHRLSAHLERTTDILIAASTALVLGLGTSAALKGALSPGDLIVFLSYLKTALRPLRDFAKYSARISKASAAAERVLEVMEETNPFTVEAGTRSAADVRGEVRFESVHFAYSPDRPALREIDLTIPAGTSVALVGPSGGGKTTIANLLLRLYDPESGQVTVDGHAVQDFELDALRARIGVVLQETMLFADSVRANIACGRADVADERITAAAGVANAHAFIEALPDGYDTLVGERGVNLSPGQRQRIAIARAVLRDVAIVIFDEPTTGLDETNRRTVLDSLFRCAEQRTALFITHDVELAKRADRIVYIRDGAILESGTYKELVDRGGAFAKMHGLDGQTAEGDRPGHAVAAG